MRKLTLTLMTLAATIAAGAASAADLPRKAPPPAMVAPAFSWTGLYIGANAGYGWGDSNGTLALPGSIDGALAGGQIGINYQFPASPVVIGIEADYQWANIEGTTGFFLPVNVELQRFGTVRGRLGFAWDRFMLYGTGGWAFAANTEVSIGGLSASRDLSGWTAGVGVEWAFAPNWSAKLEYLHLGLESKNYFGPGVCLAGCNAGLDVDLVRVGLNYRLGGLFWR